MQVMQAANPNVRNLDGRQSLCSLLSSASLTVHSCGLEQTKLSHSPVLPSWNYNFCDACTGFRKSSSGVFCCTIVVVSLCNMPDRCSVGLALLPKDVSITRADVSCGIWCTMFVIALWYFAGGLFSVGDTSSLWRRVSFLLFMFDIWGVLVLVIFSGEMCHVRAVF